jgi:hypothetical protein
MTSGTRRFRPIVVDNGSRVFEKSMDYRRGFLWFLGTSIFHRESHFH